MSIYYKFKSSNLLHSIPLVGQYLSVGNLKEKIWEAKRLHNGNDFGISLYNVQTGEEYADNSACIPRSTSVSVRRIPRLPRNPIVVAETQRPKTSIGQWDRSSPSSTVTRAVDQESGSEDDGFGEEIYALPKVCNPIGYFIPRCPNFESKPTIIAAAYRPYAIGDNIPPELKCPVCKEVMKDAVFATRCCFGSYCSECVREHRGTKSACVCGSTSMSIDDLVPNATLRETIGRMLTASATGASSGKSAVRLPALPVDVKARAAKRKPSYVDADVCRRALNSVRMPRRLSSGYGYRVPCFSRGSNVWTADFRRKQMKMSIC